MILHGDCLEVLLTIDDETVDAVVTDPPYGIGFMGHAWDQPGVQMPDTLEGVPPGQRRRANPAPSGIGRDGHAMEAGRYDLSRSANHAFQAWCEAWARECLRVLKPGGHIAAFGGARTSHRLACAIEDAGFEIRDSLMWMFGSGFPKSLDVSKAIDKAKGAEGSWRQEDHPGRPGTRVREQNSGVRIAQTYHQNDNNPDGLRHVYEPGSDEAKRWAGWGTALKPAHEPIVVGRKPLIGTVASNVLRHGTGALNIDSCRVQGADEIHAPQSDPSKRAGVVGSDLGISNADRESFQQAQRASVERANAMGRWPANVVLSHTEDCVMTGIKRVKGITGTAGQGGWNGSELYGSGSDQERGAPVGVADGDGMETVEAWECVEGCPVLALDEQTGVLTSGTGAVKRATGAGYQSGSMAGRESRPAGTPNLEYGDEGGASRFFYCAKASSAERNAGLNEQYEERLVAVNPGIRTRQCDVCGSRANRGGGEPSCGHGEWSWVEAGDGSYKGTRNPHPTVKPINLMRWLVRLITPPGGKVLDPFLGSGTTGCAAALEGFEFVGIERDPEYVKIAKTRIEFWEQNPVGIDTEKVLRADAANLKHTGQLSII